MITMKHQIRVLLFYKPKKKKLQAQLLQQQERTKLQSENNGLKEKINTIEEEKNKLVIEKDISDSKIAELNITMEEVNSKYEKIHETSELIVK